MIKKIQLLLLGLVLYSVQGFSTHNRAGEIIYEVLGDLTYRVTIITYTKTESNQADRDTLNLNWGDGTVEKVLRTNGPLVGGIPWGDTIRPRSFFGGIKRNIYVSDRHTYAGAKPFYVISVTDPNRIESIININFGASVNIQFYLEDTLRIFDPTFIGDNNSPILLYPPIDLANVGDTFYHNPAAYDPDGDSLSFKLVVPLQMRGTVVPNYQYPDEKSPGLDNNFTINSRTGEIIWAVPKQPGTYNVAILVTEYRNGIKLGTVLRDMQIIVLQEVNADPPQIVEFDDTCIIATNQLRRLVKATDRNNQIVELSAEGGPFYVSQPATFPDNPRPRGNPVTGEFIWNTACEHIRRQFYEVVFKAEEVIPVRPLADLKTWIIRIIAPPPEDLQANAGRDQITLTWDSNYPCDMNNSDFIGYSVWRRIGSEFVDIDSCTVGLSGTGYTRIASNVMTEEYVDDDVIRGHLYCYRILAEYAKRTDAGSFYNKVASIPSSEACATLLRDVPIIRNVDISNTDAANGNIIVSWYNPVPADVDTNVFPPVYSYELFRSPDTGNFALIHQFPPAVQISDLDTTYVDTVNTFSPDDQPYYYHVDFFAGNKDTLVGSTENASSIFLRIDSLDEKLNLRWEEDVPWVNFQYNIFRADEFNGPYALIKATDASPYLDVNLKNDSLYCYFVQSVGLYSDPTLSMDTLYNRSQIVCARPKDTVAPCPPVVSVSNFCRCEVCNEGIIPSVLDSCPSIENCSGDRVLLTEREETQEKCYWGDDKFQNNISWFYQSGDSCAEDVAYFQLYYQPLDEEEILIATTNTNSFVHTEELISRQSLAGTYWVRAVDDDENIGRRSNLVEVENCACYFLPNVFTPNNDGDNDEFTPYVSDISGEKTYQYRFVDKVDMKIFNRWGALVFETDDPEIHWNGRDSKSNKPLNEGVYYYVCTVFIEDGGTTQRSGFIHLIRGNGASN